ncbi:hypothetical protein [Nocardia pseudovaccinii]|uniref:hypothetical protein n=1 Tax=Nocardia pseudovaccinii TaxID=189540 RepID=UPI0007A4F62D|nr:hypothetical protein [Nocardia pseudovaccinii]
MGLDLELPYSVCTGTAELRPRPGTDCYFSHRPRFFSPFDFQVLIEIELDERGIRALGADRRTGFRGGHAFELAEPVLADQVRGDQGRGSSNAQISSAPLRLSQSRRLVNPGSSERNSSISTSRTLPSPLLSNS